MSVWGFLRIVLGIQSNRLGLRETVRGNFESRQGTQRILGYKLLTDKLMDPSRSFCHEQSNHLSGLESPGRRVLLMKTVRCGVGGFCPPLLPTFLSLETQKIHSLSLDFSNSSQLACPSSHCRWAGFPGDLAGGPLPAPGGWSWLSFDLIFCHFSSSAFSQTCWPAGATLELFFLEHVSFYFTAVEGRRGKHMGSICLERLRCV